MPITLRCPGCGRPHEDLDESVLGSDVQCRCGLIFTAAVPGGADRPAVPPKAKRERPHTPPARQPESEPVTAASTPGVTEPENAKPRVVTPQPVAPNVPAQLDQPAPATPSVRRVVPQSQPAQQPQPGTSPGSIGQQTETHIRPIRTRPLRRKKKSMLSSLVVIFLLGGAAVFGLMMVTGHINPSEIGGSGHTPEDDSRSTAQGSESQTPSRDSDRSDNDSGSFDATSGGQKSPAVAGTGNSENGDDSSNNHGTGFLVDGAPTNKSQLLEVEPLNLSVPFLADLQSQVEDAAGVLLRSRQTLTTKLNEIVLALAMRGEIDALQEVRDLQEQIANGAEVSLLDSVDHELVAETKNDYDTLLANTMASLHAAYDAAIAEAKALPDDALAAALIHERDAGFELTSQSWTVLFHSNNPQHWTQSVDGPDGMAMASGQFPSRISSLRLRRMDTKAAVVIPAGRGDLLQHTHNRGTGLGWRGDDTGVLNSALSLGLFRSAPADPNESDIVTISELPGHPCTGWGFGTTGYGIKSQAFVWNGERIDPTEFEIAVSRVRIENVTPFSIRIDMLDIDVSASDISTDIPVVPEIAAALEEHESSAEVARQEVLDAFAAELKSLGEKGDAQGIDAMIAARTEFTEFDVVESPPLQIRSKLNAFYLKLDRADDELEKAYSRTASVLKRGGKPDLARQVEAELGEGVGFDSKRWVVLLRSIDPRVWNSSSRTSQRFARPVSEAPAETQFIRMQLVRRNTSLQNSEPVICRMSVDRLTEATAQGGIGFNGMADEHHGGVHLGIFRMDKSVKAFGTTEFRGLVSLYTGDSGSYLGWGFGHILNVDQGQGYTWAGQPSRAKLEIEIAVTASPLRESESAFLLSGRANNN